VIEDTNFAEWADKHEKPSAIAPRAQAQAPIEDDGFIASLQKWASKWERQTTPETMARATPSSRGGARKTRQFQFQRGDIRGNLQQILGKAESPDYITLAGGRKVRELKNMTVAEIGKQFGNKAAGRYQIQRNTAISVLKEAGLDPAKYRFDEAGQERLYDLLLNRRGYKEYRAGKISKEEFATRLSMEWAGLPKDISGKSYYEGVGSNKAHIPWGDVLRALD
jgi:hypothetical protein